MASCDRPDCDGGEIDEQGFCIVCDRPPLRPVAAADPSGPGTPGGPRRTDAARQPQPSATARPDPWWGLALVGRGTAPPPPDEPVSADGLVPEEQRFCVNGHPAGRGRDGRPGRLVGFCGSCRAAYDFTSADADRAASVIARRYRVKRTLGDGGFGSASNP